MKRTTRLALIALFVVLFVTSTLVLAACNKGISKKDALAAYDLELNPVISEDFTLPAELGDETRMYPTKWTASNDAITIVEREGKDTLAQVNLGTNYELTEVTLTVSLGGKHTKSWTTKVDYFEVYTFTDHYKFKQDRAKVGKDFDLDTSFTYKGETASIAWSVPSAYSSLLQIVDNGAKCKVILPDEGTAPAELVATFTYKDEDPVAITYSVTVGEVMEHLEQINEWYTDGGTVAMDGYVVAFGQNYQNKNVSLYVVDEDFCSGYYLYAINYDMSKLDELVAGAPISVTGAVVQTPYYGLIETRGGDLTVRKADPVNVDEHIYAADNDIVGNWLEATYHTGVLASLTNWKVKAVDTSFDGTEDRGAFLTLEKGGVEVGVAFNKYMEGCYLQGSNELKALLNKGKEFAVGSYVTVKGVLYVSGPQDAKSSVIDGNWQILPRSEADLAAGAEDTTADADLVGTKVKAAIAAVKAKVDEYNLSSIIISDKTLTMPTEVGGVAITYTVCGTERAVTVDGGSIKVVPINVQDDRNIQVTYKVGEFETHTFFAIHSRRMTDAQILAEVEKLVAAEKQSVEKASVIELLTAEKAGYPGVTIEWTSKDGLDSTCFELKDSKLTIKQLPKAATDLVLVAKVKVGSLEVKEIEVTIKVAAAPNTIIEFTAIEEAKEGTFIFGMYQANLEKWYFATGEMNATPNYYFATTDKLEEAGKFTITKVDTQYKIANAAGKFMELYMNGTYVNLRFADTATTLWDWSAELGIFTQTFESKTYYLGVFGQDSFIRQSETKYITGENAKNVGVTQFVAYFGSAEELEINSLKAIEAPAAGTYQFGMYNGDKNAYYFATGEVNTSGYLLTSEDPAEAADFVIAKVGDNQYTITVGGKFLEFVPRTGTSTGVNAVLQATQTQGKVWKWVDAIKNFVFESTYNKSGAPEETDLYYFGNYSGNTTLSGNYIGRIATKAEDGTYTAKENTEGVSQWVAHFGRAIVDPKANEEIPTLEPGWNLITNVLQLKEGAKVVIVSGTVVMGGLNNGNGSYLKQVDGVVLNEDGNMITTLPDGAVMLTLAKSGENWTFSNGADGLLGMKTSGNAAMSFGLNGAIQNWEIKINSLGIATIKAMADGTDTWVLQYNKTNTRFGTYKGTQANPSIFMLVEADASAGA